MIGIYLILSCVAGGDVCEEEEWFHPEEYEHDGLLDGGGAVEGGRQIIVWIIMGYIGMDGLGILKPFRLILLVAFSAL